MSTQLLLSWWYLIFELPFGLGLLYLAVYTLSGWTFGDAGADGAMDHDVDASVDADGHLSFEHDLDAHSDAHADGNDTDHDQAGSSLLAVLNWIGVGRAPLSLVLMVLMLSWGTIGFCGMQLLVNQPFELMLIASILIAAIGSIGLTHVVSTMVSRFLPTTESYARRRHELLGSLAEALYPIDSTFGMATGRDDRGERFEVACRTEANQPPVAKGAPVQLVGYTAKDRMFFVVPATGAQTPRSGVKAGNSR